MPTIKRKKAPAESVATLYARILVLQETAGRHTAEIQRSHDDMVDAKRHIMTSRQRLDGIEVALGAHCNQIAALEEAICPQVASRLTALERFQMKQIGANHLFGEEIAKQNERKAATVPFDAVASLVDAVENFIGTVNANPAAIEVDLATYNAYAILRRVVAKVKAFHKR